MCPADNRTCTETQKGRLFVQFSGVDLVELHGSNATTTISMLRSLLSSSLPDCHGDAPRLVLRRCGRGSSARQRDAVQRRFDILGPIALYERVEEQQALQEERGDEDHRCQPAQEPKARG